ncbi:hypothetical protein EYZ11_003818 [Aspergillus tanneri]|uniref:Septum-promoting GTP-binding protein 1 n=1 Tax=Aspergillus tanneri TaxID=1220188 RepID=A0A4S3JMD4_9EURO|nr:uncharacterized protein ATNIH1004_003533 [Aspergillus tanneri]KAA8650844.1 hypothetical protein ATNIH1004_003533 [Aspergillus tanneri]THC96712.1 hypothetical protein EYZ11_003818 [Aspergillus tanneri]
MDADATHIPPTGPPDAPERPQEHQETHEIPGPATEMMAPGETRARPAYNNNGYSSDSRAHYSSHSYEFHSPGRDVQSVDGDQSRPNLSSSLSHQPLPSSSSRPSSDLSHSHERQGQSQPTQESSQKQSSQQTKNSVVIKVGMVGDAQIGKTSLMVKYVEGSWDEDYIQTLGVNFMEKTISIRNTEITFSIWDLGGQREFVNMLPLVCNDAVAILFMFDLTRKSTLNSIKEWYRQGRGFNKTAIPFLIGTKYDHFVNFPREDQEEISIQARRFARAMKASLIFSSTSHSINVQKIFKIVLAKAFDLKCTIPEIENVGEPLLLYKNV